MLENLFSTHSLRKTYSLKQFIKVEFFLSFLMCGLFLTTLITLFTSTIFVKTADAQGFQLFSNEDISLSTKPETPGPFETVEVSLVSFALNLESHPIEWYLNGERISGGVGDRFISFEMKDVDSIMVIEARVTITSGQVLTAREAIRPLSVDILWHAEETFTPPFFRGRSLPSAESAIRVTAIPYDSSRSDQFIYNWTRDTEPIGRQSGYKSNSITVKNNFFQKETPVGVEVSRRNGTQRGVTTTTIPRFEPRIIFETISSEIGQSPLSFKDNVNLSQGFTILRALPYYFTYTSLDELDIQWQINTDKQELNPRLPKNEISLSAPNGESGRAAVKATIEHTVNLLQEAEASIFVDF